MAVQNVALDFTLTRDTQAAVSRNTRGFFHYCLARNIGRGHKRLVGAACSLQ
jgi:hypothetical protein